MCHLKKKQKKMFVRQNWDEFGALKLSVIF